MTSASLVLPGHSHLVKEDNYLKRTHSVAFTLKYTTLQDFSLIKQIMPRQLTPKELENIGKSIPEPQTGSIIKLQGQLQRINTKYPYVMPMYLKIVIACIGTVLLAPRSLLGYRCYKNECTKGKLLPLLGKRSQKSLFKHSIPASKEYFSDTSGSPWQRTMYHPTRSSVVIQEMELQPMVPARDTRLSSSTQPVIQAPEETSVNHPL